MGTVKNNANKIPTEKRARTMTTRDGTMPDSDAPIGIRGNARFLLCVPRNLRARSTCCRVIRASGCKFVPLSYRLLLVYGQFIARAAPQRIVGNFSIPHIGYVVNSKVTICRSPESEFEILWTIDTN